MTTLDSRHAVVTGGGTGVGAATAQALANAGATVTILGRRLDPLRQVADQHAAITAISADVADRASVDAALEQARDNAGPIDIMVASAGVSSSKPFHRLAASDLDDILAINVRGVFNSFQPAYDDMRASGWGRLIAIASTAGLTGYGYVSHYCASKHAVIGMVRALAQETGTRNTTVNAICPSYVDTPMTTRTIDNIVEQTGRSRAEALAALTQANPQGRLITPEEVAGTILWLCSDAAASVNGKAITLDGGEL